MRPHSGADENSDGNATQDSAVRDERGRGGRLVFRHGLDVENKGRRVKARVHLLRSQGLTIAVSTGVRGDEAVVVYEAVHGQCAVGPGEGCLSGDGEEPRGVFLEGKFKRHRGCVHFIGVDGDDHAM